MIRKISALLFIIAMPLFVLLTSTQILVQSDGFFLDQYQVNGVVEATKIQLDELMKITEEIQDFLLGDREDFAITGMLDGKEVQIFNEREIVHMKDVQDLFRGGMILRNLCGVSIVVFGLFLWKKDKKTFYGSMKASAIGFLIMGFALAFLLISNFDQYFNLFHEIFFKNDFWILDPNDSVLINMVNINFFMNIAGRILGLTMVTMMILGMIGYMGLKKEGKYARKR